MKIREMYMNIMSRADSLPKGCAPVLAASLLPVCLVYCEVVLQMTGTVMNGKQRIGGIILIAAGCGLVLESLAGSLRSAKAGNGVRIAVSEISAVWFLVAYFTDNSYRVFMDPASILGGVRGVVTEFGGTLLTIVTSGFPMILLYHLPLILWLLQGKKRRSRETRSGAGTAVLLLSGVLAAAVGIFSFLADQDAKAKMTTDYNYDTSVRSLGLITSTVLDTRYMAFGNPYESVFVDPDGGEQTSAETEETEPAGSGEPVKTYDRNVMDVDFDTLIAETNDATLKGIYSYLSKQPGSYQNEYTGKFEGKNLILICAEAFAKEVIDPVRTPTLYRLATKGIVFEDYYQPAWGGSTSSGEFSFLTGIIPVEAVSSVTSVMGHDLRFTLGNQLKEKGYYTAGYHDGEYTYYDRHKTHRWFGYENWMGRGNGMEQGCPFIWPESDEDMFRYTLPMYINEDHFNIYYMTISGHANYSLDANAMSERNWEVVKDLSYTYAVRCYLAANQELEKGLTYLVEALEEAGKADDTVIVITADHYPYGLEDSTAWATSGDCLADLYGYPADSFPARDHNALIIWSGSLEEEEPAVIEGPTYSLDIVPTLSNLFGLEYDSRFLVGRDVFSNSSPLVVWKDRSWMTTMGYYDGTRNIFTPNEGVSVSDQYIETVKAIVQNKFAYSRAFHNYDLLRLVFGETD